MVRHPKHTEQRLDSLLEDDRLDHLRPRHQIPRLHLRALV